ncbi:Fur family transcriptional regulator [Candidatus Latescibacterota bacterium]
MTRKKYTILDEIITCARPLSAQELHKRVSAVVRVDLVTVFQALNVFKEKDLVREITDDTGTRYFEIACIHNPVHPHFMCIECREIICLRLLNDKETEYVSQFESDCEISDISIMISGLSKRCKKTGS